MTENIASVLARKMGSVVAEYQLKIVPLDEMEALLVGKNYALHFSADRDGVEVSYLERDRRSGLTAYTLRPLVMQRFTKEDQMKYGNPETVLERMSSGVSVYASGLANRCRDVLSGEKTWLKRDAWAADKPSEEVERVLRRN